MTRPKALVGFSFALSSIPLSTATWAIPSSRPGRAERRAQAPSRMALCRRRLVLDGAEHALSWLGRSVFTQCPRHERDR
jgi:hypothetical protein